MKSIVLKGWHNCRVSSKANILANCYLRFYCANMAITLKNILHVKTYEKLFAHFHCIYSKVCIDDVYCMNCWIHKLSSLSFSFSLLLMYVHIGERPTWICDLIILHIFPLHNGSQVPSGIKGCIHESSFCSQSQLSIYRFLIFLLFSSVDCCEDYKKVIPYICWLLCGYTAVLLQTIPFIELNPQLVLSHPHTSQDDYGSHEPCHSLLQSSRHLWISTHLWILLLVSCRNLYLP